jgi:hypothetical protein
MKGVDPVAVFVTDQSFPSFLPTDDCNCAVVVRVEDRRLFVIVRDFKDIFACSTKPHGKLPIGSRGSHRLPLPLRLLQAGELCGGLG